MNVLPEYMYFNVSFAKYIFPESVNNFLSSICAYMYVYLMVENGQDGHKSHIGDVFTLQDYE